MYIAFPDRSSKKDVYTKNFVVVLVWGFLEGGRFDTPFGLRERPVAEYASTGSATDVSKPKEPQSGEKNVFDPVGETLVVSRI